jgi:hypothetical protein
MCNEKNKDRKITHSRINKSVIEPNLHESQHNELLKSNNLTNCLNT